MPAFKFMSFKRRHYYSFEGDFYTFPDHDYEEVGETCELMPPIFEESAPRRITHYDINELTDEEGYPELPLAIIKQRKQEKVADTYITTEKNRFHIHRVEGKEITIAKRVGEHEDCHERYIDLSEENGLKMLDKYVAEEAASERENTKAALSRLFLFFAYPKETDKPLSASKAYECLGGMRVE